MPAGDVLKIIIQAVDNASGAVKKVSGSLGEFAKKATDIQNAFRAFIGIEAVRRSFTFASASIRDFLEESAKIKTIGALAEQQGYSWEKWGSRVENFAKTLQDTAGIMDDEVYQSIAQLVGMGYSLSKSIDIINAGWKTSIVFGKPLAEVTDAIGRAGYGATRGLRQFGIRLSENEKGIKAVDKATKVLNERLTETAQKRLGDLDINMKIVQGRFQDIREEIGKNLVPIWTELTQILLNNMNTIKKVALFFSMFVRTLFEMGRSVFQFAKMLKSGFDLIFNLVSFGISFIYDTGKAVVDYFKRLLNAILPIVAQLGLIFYDLIELNFKGVAEKAKALPGVVEKSFSSFTGEAKKINIQIGNMTKAFAENILKTIDNTDKLMKSGSENMQRYLQDFIRMADEWDKPYKKSVENLKGLEDRRSEIGDEGAKKDEERVKETKRTYEEIAGKISEIYNSIEKRTTEYRQRIMEIRAEMTKDVMKRIDLETKYELQKINDTYNERIKEIEKNEKEIQDIIKEAVKEKIITEEQGNEEINKINKKFAEERENLEKAKELEITRITKEGADKRLQVIKDRNEKEKKFIMDVVNYFVDKWKEAREKEKQAKEEFERLSRELWENVGKSFSNNLNDMILEGKSFADAMKDVWKKLISDIVSMITEQFSKNLFAPLISQTAGAINAMVQGVAGSLAKLSGILAPLGIGAAIGAGVGGTGGAILGGIAGALTGGTIGLIAGAIGAIGGAIFARRRRKRERERQEREARELQEYVDKQARYFSERGFSAMYDGIARTKEEWNKVFAHLQELMKKVQEIIASAVSKGLEAANIKQGIIDFTTSLRQSLYDNIVKGMIDAFTQTAVYQRAIAPLIEVINKAVDEATKTGVFDPQKYQQLIQPALNFFESQIGILQQGFGAVYQTAQDIKDVLGLTTEEVGQIATGGIEERTTTTGTRRFEGNVIQIEKVENHINFDKVVIQDDRDVEMLAKDITYMIETRLTQPAGVGAY